MNDQIDQSAAHTLDRIQEGGRQLCIVARERLGECEKAIAEGRFTDAHDRAAELLARLEPLASAQVGIAAFGGSYVIRAADVTEGITLRHWGRVMGVTVTTVPCAGADHEHVGVVLRFEDGPDRQVPGDQELIALRDSDPAA